MSKVSVVIVVKNGARHLEKCLKSIFSQKDVDFEVIIIYEKSTDNTLEIIFKYPDNRRRVVEIPEGTTIGRARQYGVEEVQGDIIAWIDSDVELPHEHWLKNMLVPFKNTHIAGTTTLAKCHSNDPWYLKWQHGSFEYKGRDIGIDNYQIIGTSHILIRKNLIEQVGGFKDVSTYEDLDVTKKIMEMGYIFEYLPEEKCYHYFANSFTHFLKKRLKSIKLNFWSVLLGRK